MNIKSFIPKKKFESFLEFILNEESIYEMDIFLKSLYNNQIYNYEYYKPIAELLYFELLSYHDLKYIVSSSNIENINTLKEIAYKCLGFSIDKKSASKTYFMRDLIKYIYYGRTDVESYKDQSNIANEFASIYNDFSEEEKATMLIFPGLFENNIVPETISSSLALKFAEYFCRINNHEATIEKYIPYISCLVNQYDVDDIFGKTEVLNLYKKQFPSNYTAVNPTEKYRDLILKIFSKITARTIYS